MQKQAISKMDDDEVMARKRQFIQIFSMAKFIRIIRLLHSFHAEKFLLKIP
jgi:hypothetical protein